MCVRASEMEELGDNIGKRGIGAGVGAVFEVLMVSAGCSSRIGRIGVFVRMLQIG